MESRKKRASQLFKSGCNCAQAVFAVFAEEYGIDEETALKISASFGGGMGRMREVCGTVSAMFMVAGLETGTADMTDLKGKKYNYDVVQRLAELFKIENGSIVCKELLGLVPMNRSDVSVAEFKETTPEARTKEYYKKRPCNELVENAVEILEQVLFESEGA